MGVKGEKTKELICEVAKGLFVAKGYKQVTMQEICDATKLSKGGLYRHYKSKEEIFLAVLDRSGIGTKEMKEGTTARQTLEAYLEQYRIEMLDTKNSLAFALFEYASLGNEEIFLRGMEEDRKRWKQIIENGIATGEFREVDPEVVMDSFLYAYRGICMWRQVLPIDVTTMDHIIEAVRCMVFK